MAVVATYRIFGREVGAHVLSMATLGTAFGIGFLSLSGGKKSEPGPAINAKSKEEESFVKDFIKKAEGEKK
ncbi:hypothetical protein EJ04DRAFT_515552 [Polyplosphaeria fusca]|uniref:ATP synthase subunit K, mitochondrial n=1 Tax=Polyplosphaeria fusca TaxID=682080 RepID=A0A9P4QP92_9PLEO|nr:hypothetical protein EJ04DRAFT_515552 [Polyplosphaeria fusca]